jgi:DNA-binding NarL/FixJ family response regulator
MNKKILVIDDYEPLLEEVSEFLELENYKVITAKNGAEGVQKAITGEPDLIICDILMPELDGYQVYEAISQIPSLQTVPFIFLTARATSDDFRKGLSLGVDDYLTKPFTIDELLMTVRKRFEKIEKYKATKQDIVEFLFSNPFLGIAIFDTKEIRYVNEKIKLLFGYELKELNEAHKDKIIIGNKSNLERDFNLLKAGVLKVVETELGIIKKDKKVCHVQIFVKPIIFDKKNCFISCVYEKEHQTNNTNISTGISKFLDYLDTTNNKEMSTEISAIFQKMQIEEKVKSSEIRNKIKISDREKEILELICKGMTNKDIAEKLFLSPRTIDNHRANMLAKTKTKNSAELIAFAVKNGIIDV